PSSSAYFLPVGVSAWPDVSASRERTTARPAPKQDMERNRGISCLLKNWCQQPDGPRPRKVALLVAEGGVPVFLFLRLPGGGDGRWAGGEEEETGGGGGGKKEPPAGGARRRQLPARCAERGQPQDRVASGPRVRKPDQDNRDFVCLPRLN